MGKVFAIIFIIIFFFSCGRKSGDILLPRTQNDSVYIKSLFVLDSSRSNYRDTVLKFYFEYDANKRISQISEFRWEDATNNFKFSSEVNFSYQGLDTLPSMLLTTIRYNSVLYDTIYLTYSNGRIIRDSSAYGIPGSPKSYVLFNFRQLNNNVFESNFIDSVNGFVAYRERAYSFVNWQNGNLLSERDTFGFDTPPTGFAQSMDYTYDQRPNPLRKAFLNFPSQPFNSRALTMAHGNWYLKFFANRSANNILTERYNPGNDFVSWNYTYGSNGMPQKAIRYTGTANSWTSIFKVYYYYTSF